MLDTYNNLVKELIDWSHRNDLSNKIHDFIALAETAIYSNDVEVLAIRSMEIISTALTAGQYLALPDNFESARSVRLVTGDNGGELKFQAPEQMHKQVTTGRPNFFTVVGNELQFDRVPDSEYTIEIQYFRKANPLTEANQVNQVHTNHPAIYLYGSLAQIFAYTQDDQQAAKYGQLFLGAVKGANKAHKKGSYGPAPSMSLDGGMIV